MASELDDFLNDDEQEYDWAIPGMLERRDRLIFTGGEGHGKSTLLRQMAVTTSAGLHPLDPTQKIEPLRVLLADFENPKKILSRSLAALRSKVERANLAVVSRPEGLDIPGSPDDRKWLRDEILETSPDLLIIGPLYKLASDDLKEDRVSKPISTLIDELRAEFGFAVIIEAHSPHAAQGLTRPIRPYGASLWLRWPEFGLHLAKDGEIKHYRPPRDSRDWPKSLMRGGDWPWTTDTTTAFTKDDHVKRDICEVIKAHSGLFTAGKGKLLGSIKGDRTANFTKIRELVDAGFISEIKYGNALHYRLHKMWGED
ncbi:AAA family ATPase [Micromonospora sp. NPDC047187]|uniref:AAA family ATPase n=1 Tax=Micromonospora sp. NPDC047187 TaxID=3155262 RepID=UPI0033C52205